MIRAYLDERTPGHDALYVDRESGPIVVLTDGLGAEFTPPECFALPTGADELIRPYDAAEWAWEQINPLTLTKKARREIRAALGLEEE